MSYRVNEEEVRRLLAEYTDGKIAFPELERKVAMWLNQVRKEHQGDFPATVVRPEWAENLSEFTLEKMEDALLALPLESDRFVRGKKIGSGATCSVYVAVEKNVQRDVALKILRQDKLNDPGLVRIFLNEARRLARLTHPNIPTMLELSRTAEGQPCIAMELLTARTLLHGVEKLQVAERLQSGDTKPPSDWGERLEMVRALARDLWVRGICTSDGGCPSGHQTIQHRFPGVFDRLSWRLGAGERIR